MNYYSIFNKLLKYVENENFRGWDPYDGLSSKVFKSLFLDRFFIFRLIFIQFFKRSPINFRKILFVQKGYNSKGLALFISSYCNLYKMNAKKKYYDKIFYLIDKLYENEVKTYSGSCWGYNFDWQARAFFQPKNTPTVVASVFAGYSLLDAYDIIKDKNLLKKSRSICDFILNDLNRTYDKSGNFCFSYSPLDSTQVFNASLLASRLLSRVYAHTNEKKLIVAAKKSIAYCVKHQNSDGSWPYGNLSHHKWIDNFHTGYNIECISEYVKYSGDNSYDKVLKKGLDYYLKNFFTKHGEPKYYNNKLYPIDLHSTAQLILTLSRMDIFIEHKSLIDRVLNWSILNMQDKKGFFYYQKNKFFTNKIPYMRWTQAWMFFSLTEYLKIQNES